MGGVNFVANFYLAVRSQIEMGEQRLTMPALERFADSNQTPRQVWEVPFPGVQRGVFGCVPQLTPRPALALSASIMGHED